MLKKLWAKFVQYFMINKDTYISNTTLKNSLKRQFGDVTILIRDKRTYTLSKKVVERAIMLNVFRFFKWKKEVHDCDDFAFEFMGLMTRFYPQFSFGIVFAFTPIGNHALNCFIDQFNKFWYIEPQTNEIIEANEDYIPYLIII